MVSWEGWAGARVVVWREEGAVPRGGGTRVARGTVSRTPPGKLASGDLMGKLSSPGRHIVGLQHAARAVPSVEIKSPLDPSEGIVQWPATVQEGLDSLHIGPHGLWKLKMTHTPPHDLTFPYAVEAPGALGRFRTEGANTGATSPAPCDSLLSHLWWGSGESFQLHHTNPHKGCRQAPPHV